MPPRWILSGFSLPDAHIIRIHIIILYPTTSGQESLTFRLDPLSSDDDITPYMQYGFLQTTSSLLLFTIICFHPALLPSDIASIRHLLPSICFCLSCSLATSSAHFHKVSHHPHVSWPQLNLWPLSLWREGVECSGRRDNGIHREDKVPLRDNRSATHGKLYLRGQFCSV